MVYAAFMIGLLGSMHCLGMCGPIAMALPVRTRNTWMKVLKYLMYNLGRILTYGVLGFLAGIIGEGFAFAGLQKILSITAGVVIIVSVFQFPLFRTSFLHPVMSRFTNSVKKTFGHYFYSSAPSLFLLGMLNGLLPCGMIYMALLGALASDGTWSAALFMMSFGAGTAPMMLTVSLAGHVISRRTKSFIQQFTPVLTVLVGLLLIVRGLNMDASQQLAMHPKHVYKCH